MESFTYFWRTESPFSQWHPAVFKLEDQTFNCAEQYMMYAKANLFGDNAIAERILRARSPIEQKKLGRSVSGFQQDLWASRCKAIVYTGNYAKFTQNEHLLAALLSTQGTTLVEASPDDRVWGVGLSEDDPAICDRRTWKGTNWLGEVLTQLREDLIARR
ncbi:NADAR family protein [Paenibacillus athensensis]|uniref:GTP cyclohydrolase n=1 Tax=Paenibacillus athensensis TaxID=1967502 RepID=A0A4Y8PPU7_9BACL|nr:NADAR family protein [Paenibacillus athensensis]MCD1259442.1 NADAR family protein [Paenibacillus athensensis]